MSSYIMLGYLFVLCGTLVQCEEIQTYSFLSEPMGNHGKPSLSSLPYLYSCRILSRAGKVCQTLERTNWQISCDVFCDKNTRSRKNCGGYFVFKSFCRQQQRLVSLN